MKAGRAGLILALCAGTWGCGDGSPNEPEAPGVLDDYALHRPVQIVLDDSRVPHLRAESALDGFFAQGYQQASDALFMLEVTRRSASGTLAEVLGAKSLASDQQALTFDFQRWAEASLELMRSERPADYELLVAFVGGINRRIDEVVAGSVDTPPEFQTYAFLPEHWTPTDVMAIGVRIQVGFSSTLSFDILNTLVANIVPDAEQLPVFASYGSSFYMKPQAKSAKWTLAPSAPKLPGALDHARAKRLFQSLESLYRNHGMGEGSNNWVVDGARTDNGRPYLANDSHATLTDPNRMHVIHVTAGEFDVIGTAFLGIPGVHVGHNRRVAWGATTNFADTMDLWDVQVDGDQVSLGGVPVTLETRERVIRVKQMDGSFSEEPFQTRFVPGIGVLVPSTVLPVPKFLVAKGELLLGWPGFRALDELFLFLDFDRAEDLADFEAAVDIGKTGMQNWVGASADGIRLRVHGFVPDRGPAANRPRANRVMDGSDPTTLWTGAMLTREQLPAIGGDVPDGALATPPFIATANNDPWGHTADNDPLNDAFYYGSFYEPGFRAARLTQRLDDLVTPGGVNRTAMEELQTEVHSILADAWLPLLDESMKAIGSDPTLAPFVGRTDLVDAAGRLATWDRRMTRASEEACLFRLFAAFVSRATLEPALGELFEGIDEAQPVTIQKIALLTHSAKVDAFLKGKANSLRVQALSDALAEQIERAQGGTYTWGDLHRAVFKKPDGAETLVESGGDDTTLNVAQSHCWKDGELQDTCLSTAGAVYRFVIGFEENGTPRATFVVPAANASSTEGWVEGSYAPLRFEKADIDAHITSQYELLPSETAKK